MDGIILINKEKGITSRDVVNMLCKKLNTKRIGHTGTLDPIATGLMVISIGEGLKLVEYLTGHDKEYIAKVKLGIKTDTYDITGEVLEESNNYSLTKEKLIETLNSFKGEYEQVVPIYSSVKVNGKKLYEYARSKESVELPKHLVKINSIELIDLNNDNFTFKVTVSSGTYIRSLINDIGNSLNIPMTMQELKRTKVGKYKLEDATDIDNIKIIPLLDAVDIKKVEVDDSLYKKVANGAKINNIYNEPMIMFIKDNVPIAIYKSHDNHMKPYRVFYYR